MSEQDIDYLDNAIGEDIFENNPILSSHFRCASHTLNLLSTTDTNKIIEKEYDLKITHKTVIEKCQEIWSSLRSTQKREKLTTFLGKSLKKPVATRWNSLYDSLEQMYSVKDKLMAFETHVLLQIKSLLTEDDFDYLKEYLDIMKPLACTLDILQGDSNCHYGYLLPSLLNLRRKWRHLLDREEAGTDICRPLIEELIVALENRFHDFFNIRNRGEVAAIAAVTHPRFKLTWLHCLDHEAQQRVKKLLKKIVEPKGIAPPPSRPEQKEHFFDFGEPAVDFMFFKIHPENQKETELQIFLKTPINLDLSEDLEKYPTVKQLFVKYNTILPSSAAVERLFSYATLLNIPKMNKLSDLEFEKRVLYKANSAKGYS